MTDVDWAHVEVWQLKIKIVSTISFGGEILTGIGLLHLRAICVFALRHFNTLRRHHLISRSNFILCSPRSQNQSIKYSLWFSASLWFRLRWRRADDGPGSLDAVSTGVDDEPHWLNAGRQHDLYLSSRKQFYAFAAVRFPVWVVRRAKRRYHRSFLR